MKDKIGRKLILIGAVGLLIWLIEDIIFVMVPYTKEGIENIMM